MPRLWAGDDAVPACCGGGAAVGGDWARSCVGKTAAIIITRCLLVIRLFQLTRWTPGEVQPSRPHRVSLRIWSAFARSRGRAAFETPPSATSGGCVEIRIHRDKPGVDHGAHAVVSSDKPLLEVAN